MTTSTVPSVKLYDTVGNWSAFESAINEDINAKEVNGEFKELKDGFKADCDHIKNKDDNSLTRKKITWLKQWSETFQDPKMSKIEGFDVKNLANQDKIFNSLLLEAQKARMHSYSPYSHFQVGAAILLKDGTIIHGCNVENAAFGSTICAERTAMLSSVSKINRGIKFEKLKEIVALALVLRGGGTPCGSCRQMLYEANPDMIIIKSDIDGTDKKVYTLKDLLPDGFGPENLR